MSFVAVAEIPQILSWDGMKPVSLLFDRVALLPGDINVAHHRSSRFDAEREWLRKHEVIDYVCGAAKGVDPSDLPPGWIGVGDFDSVIDKFIEAANASGGMTSLLWRHVFARAAACALQLRGDDSAVLSPLPAREWPDTSNQLSDIVSVALRKMPTPSATTSWESILEFRNDPETRGLLVRFRRWLRQLGQRSLSAGEISKEIEFLTYEYEHYMRIHDLKINTSILETVVTAGASIAENLVKLKWSDAARGFFSLKHRRVQLLEAELNAPGRDIAYIIRSRRSLRDD